MRYPLYPLLIASLLWGTILIQDASAYLDPGTGSMILQVLAAGFLGLLLTFKTWWYKIKQLFGAKTSVEATENDDSDDAL